jgi:ribosomal protein S18 acetylase RimI-like enzyme
LVGAIEAGILLVARLPHEVHLQDLYLLPRYQGQGIGSALVSALQKEAIARCVPLRLQVLKVNSAKRFYERLGFSVVEETEYFFHMQYAT